MKYRMYVDEVGNSDLDSSNNPNHRFLSLTGVILELGYVAKVVHPQMEALKGRYFDSHPDDPVILHRKELINAKPPFESLQDNKTRLQFDQEMLALFWEWEYTVVTVCIDKKRHKEKYTTWRYDPYHYCLEVLLERYFWFLRRQHRSGDVMAESRGAKEDRRLKNAFARLYENGTDYIDQERIQHVLTSKQLKVKTKANNVAGLQLADLLAHPSRCEILLENNLHDRELGAFAKKIVKVLAIKYDLVGERIYGKKML